MNNSDEYLDFIRDKKINAEKNIWFYQGKAIPQANTYMWNYQKVLPFKSKFYNLEKSFIQTPEIERNNRIKIPITPLFKTKTSVIKSKRKIEDENDSFSPTSPFDRSLENQQPQNFQLLIPDNINIINDDYYITKISIELICSKLFKCESKI